MLNVITTWEEVEGKMICPAISRSEFEGSIVKVVCLEDECAWWIDGMNVCAVPMVCAELREARLERQARGRSPVNNAAITAEREDVATICQKLGDAITAEIRKKGAHRNA